MKVSHGLKDSAENLYISFANKYKLWEAFGKVCHVRYISCNLQECVLEKE